MSFLCTVRFPCLVLFLSPNLISDLGGLVPAMGAMRVVVAAGEVVVGALVPILVPVVGLVQVEVLLLLLLVVAGETTMPVLPDNTGPVIDSRGFCVPHSLDSIVLDHRSFMEAEGDLKRAKQVLFSNGLMYSHTTCIRESIHLTKKLKVTSKIQFQSVGPLNKFNILIKHPVHHLTD